MTHAKNDKRNALKRAVQYFICTSKKQTMKQSDDNKMIPMTSVKSGKGYEVRDDIFYYTNQIVNVVFIGKPNEKNWVLIDAGMPKSAQEIIAVAEERFGKENPPVAIILTHGHFDHVGSITGLLNQWPVQVYAHPLEFPFLSGTQSYPDPDITVEGGLLAKISAYYPIQPINIEEALASLPADRTVPALPGWQWIHTPGHTPGHISLFREKDKTLIAGDAFVTVRADSFYKVLIQKEEINGPPRYLTTDWKSAHESVKKLRMLKPSLAITGHGVAMRGQTLHEGLKILDEQFDSIAVPDYGRHVDEKIKE
jgi:glyoxylase-like metal-dependent hydrolase (beta-lactamase superfamily II)